jgi:hypothetical protein
MLSPGELVQSARFAPMLLAGASDRVEEGWFRARNRTGERAPQSGVDVHAQAQDAVRAGLGFLARAQRPDGLWRGFMLAPGASTEWITAHVALLLEDLPEARAMRERAARGLLASTRGRPGWGYNHRVGIDSDSTAQAIMVLHGLGHAIEEAWIEQLLATHREEGGFGTYATTRPDGQPRTWWEMPHADVTLIVVEALARLDRCAEEREQASAWLEHELREGVLPAYWWTSPAYSLWAQARAGFHVGASSGAARRLLPGEQRSIYLAMLTAAALAGAGWSQLLASAVARLVRARREDGSWRCAPCLRNTYADHPGGFEAPGPIYADRYRVISTAHAVAALARALQAMP